jgi:Protein of unknown function (DUF3363)
LVDCGLARRQQGQVIFAQDLLDTLTRRELADTATQISRQTGLAHRPVEEGDDVSGIYRRRVDLASGRFALIEDGQQFSLMPWRPIVDRQLGREGVGCLARRRHFLELGARTPAWNLISSRAQMSTVRSAHDRSRSIPPD